MNSVGEKESQNINPVPNLQAVSAKLLEHPTPRDFASTNPLAASPFTQTPPFPNPLDPLEYWRTWALTKLSRLKILNGDQDYRYSITDPHYWKIENDHYNILLAPSPPHTPSSLPSIVAKLSPLPSLPDSQSHASDRRPPLRRSARIQKRNEAVKLTRRAAETSKHPRKRKQVSSDIRKAKRKCPSCSH